MKKRILSLLLSIIMIISAVSVLASCSLLGGGDDDTAECEECGAEIKANDKDGLCADCAAELNGDDDDEEEHVCDNGEKLDGKCDECGKTIKHSHSDDDKNGKCDFCSKKMSSSSGDSGYPEVPWEVGDITLKFMMSDNTNGKQNPSGCHRYLAGDSGDKSELDTLIFNRNSDAKYYTKVDVVYDYYPDTQEYGWGTVNNVIFTNCSSAMSGKPDIYCNFTYDLVAASLNGSFNNLMNKNLDKGNYFQFLKEGYNEAVDNKGYMYEYMTSTTLSQHKMYILASDYFLDLVRSFFIVPVNSALLNTVGPDITGDLNGNGKFTIEDLYEEVRNKNWDYDLVIEYSNAVYKNTGTSNAGEDIEDVLGLALGAGGLMLSGLLYSTNIQVINKTFNAEKEVAGMPGVYGDYEYSYPTASEPLEELAVALKRLVEATGVYAAGYSEDPNISNYGASAILAVRARFCKDKVLFGDVIVLGALEYTEYQELKDSSGFGVVPVPFHHKVEKESSENYLTSIHNNSRPGAIAKNTKNFTACTAFLDYQSSHSKQILNDYYNINLQTNVVDTNEEGGTVEMLQYIRNNVRSVFEKTFEDAIGFYKQDLSTKRWHGLVGSGGFTIGEGIRGQYQAIRDAKQEVLDTLYQKYPNLP